MKDMNAYINVSMTGNQAEELQTLIGSDLRKTETSSYTFTLMKRRMLLAQVAQQITDALEEFAPANYSESDGTGTV